MRQRGEADFRVHVVEVVRVSVGVQKVDLARGAARGAGGGGGGVAKVGRDIRGADAVDVRGDFPALFVWNIYDSTERGVRFSEKQPNYLPLSPSKFCKISQMKCSSIVLQFSAKCADFRKLSGISRKSQQKFRETFNEITDYVEMLSNFAKSDIRKIHRKIPN